MREFNAAFDTAAMFAPFGNPSVDATVATQRRNLEAVFAANRIAADGFKALAQRQAEIARGAVDDYFAAVRELMTVKDTPANLAKQVEVARTAFEKSVVNTRELTGIAAAANVKAFDVLNNRVAAGIDELGGLSKPASAQPASAQRASVTPAPAKPDSAKPNSANTGAAKQA